MRLTPNRTRRPAAAAVEFAFVMTFILAPTMIGTWEVGRLVQVQQIVANAAREGARLASQAVTITPEGDRVEIQMVASSPSVNRTIYQYLVLNGLPQLEPSDVTTSFRFLSGANAGNASAQPFQGQKGDRYEIVVTVPFDKVKWVNLGLVNPSKVSFAVTWTMMVDDPFQIDPELPSW